MQVHHIFTFTKCKLSKAYILHEVLRQKSVLSSHIPTLLPKAMASQVLAHVRAKSARAEHGYMYCSI